MGRSTNPKLPPLPCPHFFAIYAAEREAQLTKPRFPFKARSTVTSCTASRFATDGKNLLGGPTYRGCD